MNADERVARISVKIERAKKHIEDLYAEVAAYLASTPYVVGSKVYPHPRLHRAYYLKEIKPIPDPVRAITGDILFNARSALDHLAFSLVEVRGFVDDQGAPLSEGEIRDIYFPILDVETAEEYIASNSRNRKVKGMAKVARDAIDRTKPYKGGDKALWRLHKLHNVDKHRLVVTAASALRHIDLTPMREFFQTARKEYFVVPNFLIASEDRVCPAKKGQTIFIDEINPKADKQIQPFFEVVLHEPGVVECEPLMPTIHYMVDLAEYVVGSFRDYLV
jgi:hypothetical protein